MKDESKKKLIVGFQGVPGSFGEEALLAYFGDSVCTKALDTFEDIFKKLIGQEIDFGVLPIENSSTGAITEVYDLLNQYDCSIIGEVCLPIQHHLMGIRGASIADIREVYSHPQGFEQSSKFLKQYPNWKLIPYYNTAKSAEWVQKNNQKHMGAIASEKAAKLYNLQILAFGINSNQHNTTRFIIAVKRKFQRFVIKMSYKKIFSVILSMISIPFFYNFQGF
jgi:chorismate mutase/prephenate dehydratase